jgi:hypothetical protein
MSLMDAGLAFAPRVRVELQRSVEDVARFSLPVWAGADGSLRIALPVHDPEHGADNLQLIVPLGELVETVGRAVREQAERASRRGPSDGE